SAALVPRRLLLTHAESPATLDLASRPRAGRRISPTRVATRHSRSTRRRDPCVARTLQVETGMGISPNALHTRLISSRGRGVRARDRARHRGPVPRDRLCPGATATDSQRIDVQIATTGGIAYVPKHSPRGRIPAAGWLALLVLPGALGNGCSSPTKPPAPPSGGQSFVYSYDEFAATVEPVLTRQGCDA